MRHIGAIVVTAALIVMTACGEGVPVAPTSSPPPSGGTGGTPQEPVQPRYTVNGDVRDSRGVPVPGAEIWIYGNGSPIDNRYGVTFTDNNGRYSVASPTRVPHTVRAMKDGYVRRDVPIPASASSDIWRADITIAHIDRYRLFAPADVTVGEWARLQAHIDLDDGSALTGFLFMELSSDNGAVLHVEPTGWINGVAPGTATITARYYGATTTASVRVRSAQ
jgi:protocatechuate 3,4-dioxygenase beta subunit